MNCPKCNEAMVYRNQDYVSHGWYCGCGQHVKCDQLCCARFLVLSKDEAMARKVCVGRGEMKVGINLKRLYDNTVQVIVEVDRGQLRLVGHDGGQPEDQFLCRDFKWVLPALNAAYEAGYKAGVVDGAPQPYTPDEDDFE